MSNPVSAKWYSSDMGGAQNLTGAIGGGIIALLNACLVTGFGSVTLSSLTVTSGIATATVNTGHGFLDYQVVLIAGATPSGLNGDKRITRTGTNTFTFDATGIADGTATGTITAKTSPAGWTSPFTGTNLAAFAKAAGGTQHLLRIDGTTANLAVVSMYQSMTDINTGTNASSSLGVFVSTDTSSVRKWRIYADSYAFYLFIQPNGTNWYNSTFFGDLVSNVINDSYHCALISKSAVSQSSGESFLAVVNNTNTGAVLAKDYKQSTTNVAFGRTVGYRSVSASAYLGMGPYAFPDAASRMGLVEKLQCWESGAFRGYLPGMYNLAHSGVGQFTDIWGAGDLVGRKFRTQPMWYLSADYIGLMDLAGPWR